MIIGITGKIGSGKHTLAYMMQKYSSAIILDADQLAHNLYRPKTECYHKIIKKFGESILDPKTQYIDRKKLGKTVFADPKKLQSLNRIVHPPLRKDIESRVEILKRQEKDIIIVAALIMKLKIPIDQLIIVKTHENNSILRIQRRDSLRNEEVIQRLAMQTEPKQFDEVIENNGSLTEFEEKAKICAQKMSRKISF